ncbi:MAG TPA: 6-hydroxymethylpterin diphosphokinase MptE-like protein [Vicinamibacterales bacterium]|nr:6-hydroxymethylpterin diphosphokinase MptE-like protein [Vicinamibacterales bacterium]
MTGTSAEPWLNGVPIESSSTLFFVGEDVASLRCALDGRGWRGRVIQVAPPRFDGLDAVSSSIEADAERPVLVLEPGVVRLHMPAVKQAARDIGKAWYGARANQEARRQNAGRYLRNTLRNIKSIVSSGDVRVLHSAFVGVPAIVVAAGPSLDENLPHIIAHREVAIVVAVDTALRPLLGAGVQPDLVVAVDPSEANANHLVDLPPCPATYLVAEGSLDPEALRHFAGRTFTCRIADHHPWPWLRAEGVDRGLLRAWGSVLTTAFDLALKMGCGPIAFAGADLAYTRGRPYARGTTYEESWQQEVAWGSTLEQAWSARLADWPETIETGVDGAPVRTAPHLRSFRDWIAKEAETCGRQVHNATGGGILQGPGITQASLASALGGRSSRKSVISDRLRTLYRSSVVDAMVMSDVVPVEQKAQWAVFAGLPQAEIDAVLDPSRATHVPTVAIAPVPLQGDDAFLADLAQTFSIRLLELVDASQDIHGALVSALTSLGASDAIVIADRVGISVGSQVRRAIDQLLCERTDLWLEDRRFVDWNSRLMVIRGNAGARAGNMPADASKWAPEHQAVATRLAGLIADEFKPSSVIDIGCGAGYWLKALADRGVRDLRGISPRMDGEAVAACVDRGALSMLTGDDRRFDLALCLEVTQYVAPEHHDAVIEACARASDVVVFSSRVPGAPGSSPHDRPMEYWAAKFWRHGFVVDDCLRPRLESHANMPSTLFDCLVVFRRQFSQADVDNTAIRQWALSQTRRLQELFIQRIWWTMRAVAPPAPTAAPPVSPTIAWPMPASRLAVAIGTSRRFRFRTQAARWHVTHPGANLVVKEDGELLTGWVLQRDEVVLVSSDGSDPRTNGRRYTIDLPSHVAWAESQSLEVVLRDGL